MGANVFMHVPRHTIQSIHVIMRGKNKHLILSYLIYLISLLLTNTVSRVRACLSIGLERLRGTQKEDERGPHSIE